MRTKDGFRVHHRRHLVTTLSESVMSWLELLKPTRQASPTTPHLYLSFGLGRRKTKRSVYGGPCTCLITGCTNVGGCINSSVDPWKVDTRHFISITHYYLYHRSSLAVCPLALVCKFSSTHLSENAYQLPFHPYGPRGLFGSILSDVMSREDCPITSRPYCKPGCRCWSCTYYLRWSRFRTFDDLRRDKSSKMLVLHS